MDLLLIDNSNIFIEVKKFGEGARFDYEKFVKRQIKSRKLKKILVGSTPPKSDNFWTTMTKKGFEVYTYERNKFGEKRVDTKIVAEGVEFIVQQSHPATLIIMSGDLDMGTLVEKASDKGWQVIIWSWNNSLNNEYLEGELSKNITVKYLDDVQEKLVFFDEEIDGIVKREYLKERIIRKEFDEKKQYAISQIQFHLPYLSDKNSYLDKLAELVSPEKGEEVEEILEEAIAENDNNKKVKDQQDQQKQMEGEKQKINQSFKTRKGIGAVLGVLGAAGLAAFGLYFASNSNDRNK